MANSNFLEISGYSITIASTATPQQVSIPTTGGITRHKYAFDVVIKCPSGNTSALLIGNREGQAFSIDKGLEVRLSTIMNRMSQSARFKLDELFVKAGTNGDKAEILLIGPDDDVDA